MPIRRVFTDVPAGDVPFVAAMIAADHGRIVEQLPEDDGQFTLVAEFPSPEAAPQAASPAVPPIHPAQWMAIARAEQGVAEMPGAASLPRIEAYHATTHGGVADDSVPWCASFVNFCVTQAGGRGTNSKAARSWLTWGKDSDGFVDGCIVVLQRGNAPKGHVGFFVGLDGDRIRLLGGNQSDRVCIASFDRSRVLARRLAA